MLRRSEQERRDILDWSRPTHKEKVVPSHGETQGIINPEPSKPHKWRRDRKVGDHLRCDCLVQVSLGNLIKTAPTETLVDCNDNASVYNKSQEKPCRATFR